MKKLIPIHSLETGYTMYFVSWHSTQVILKINLKDYIKFIYKPPRNQGVLYMPLHNTLTSLLPAHTQNWHFAHQQETSTMCPLVDFQPHPHNKQYDQNNAPSSNIITYCLFFSIPIFNRFYQNLPYFGFLLILHTFLSFFHLFFHFLKFLQKLAVIHSLLVLN